MQLSLTPRSSLSGTVRAALACGTLVWGFALHAAPLEPSAPKAPVTVAPSGAAAEAPSITVEGTRRASEHSSMKPKAATDEFLVVKLNVTPAAGRTKVKLSQMSLVDAQGKAHESVASSIELSRSALPKRKGAPEGASNAPHSPMSVEVAFVVPIGTKAKEIRIGKTVLPVP